MFSISVYQAVGCNVIRQSYKDLCDFCIKKKLNWLGKIKMCCGKGPRCFNYFSCYVYTFTHKYMYTWSQYWKCFLQWIMVWKVWNPWFYFYLNISEVVCFYFSISEMVLYVFLSAELFKESCPGVYLWNVASAVVQKQLWPLLWKRAWTGRPLVAPGFWIH